MSTSCRVYCEFLTGAVDDVRFNARAITKADDSVLWSAPYNKNLGDVLDLQDEISLEIVDKLKVKLLGEEKVNLLKRHTHNLDKYYI